MSDWKAVGDWGEAAFMENMTEMGWTVANTDVIMDRIKKTDVICLKPPKKDDEGNIDAPSEDVIELMFVDTKCTRHPCTPEACFGSAYNSFLVEWRSGTSNGATTLTSPTATHYAYMMRGGANEKAWKDEGEAGHLPFMLVSVEDIRAFILAHKDDPAMVEEYGDKAYKVYMEPFCGEYGFEYFSYDGKEWNTKKHGNGTRHYYLHPADASFAECLIMLNMADKEQMDRTAKDHWTAEHLHREKKLTEEETAELLRFHGDKQAVLQYIEKHIPTFDPLFAPSKKE